MAALSLAALAPIQAEKGSLFNSSHRQSTSWERKGREALHVSKGISIRSVSVPVPVPRAVALDSNQHSSTDPSQIEKSKKYYFVIANAKFMLDEEEHFNELLSERLRYYGERNKEQDFWLVIEPKFLNNFPNITKRLKRPAVALVSTNGTWITESNDKSTGYIQVLVWLVTQVSIISSVVPTFRQGKFPMNINWPDYIQIKVIFPIGLKSSSSNGDLIVLGNEQNYHLFRFMKLRLDRVLAESYEADSLEEALACNPTDLQFDKPENWVAPYPKYEFGWWEPFLPPGPVNQNA